MINILISRKEGEIVAYKISGHAKFATKGKDIICAAVSAVSQQTAIGIVDYLKINAYTEVKDGFLSLDIENSDKDGKEKEIKAMLETMYIMLSQIEEQYPGYVKLSVKEVK